MGGSGDTAGEDHTRVVKKRQKPIFSEEAPGGPRGQGKRNLPETTQTKTSNVWSGEGKKGRH